eukprot:TRINITY_DN600_c0_g1_i6.p1 TRINITY_DN600_c0_g1~~TRINITY_DN600_c0_g1_i6.p1  ORF type:complete len:544 (-),score=184.84 TRINITY_DN600_c0_g1_i6:239-1807(-)
MANLLHKLVAEAFGTFWLTFAVSAGSFATSALAFLVFTLGHISGAHFNPVVTVANVILNPKDLKNLSFIVVQCISAILGAMVHNSFLPAIEKAPFVFATSDFSGFIVEAIATMILVFVILSVAHTGLFASHNFFIGMAIGNAIGLVPKTIMNPAVALGLHISAKAFHTGDFFIHMFAPFVGMGLAIGLFWILFPKQVKSVKAEDGEYSLKNKYRRAVDIVEETWWRPLIAEFFGSFVLTFAPFGTALFVESLSVGEVFGFHSIIGVVMMVMTYSLRSVSGSVFTFQTWLALVCSGEVFKKNNNYKRRAFFFYPIVFMIANWSAMYCVFWMQPFDKSYILTDFTDLAFHNVFGMDFIMSFLMSIVFLWTIHAQKDNGFFGLALNLAANTFIVGDMMQVFAFVNPIFVLCLMIRTTFYEDGDMTNSNYFLWGPIAGGISAGVLFFVWRLIEKIGQSDEDQDNETIANPTLADSNNYQALASPEDLHANNNNYVAPSAPNSGFIPMNDNFMGRDSPNKNGFDDKI